VCESLREREREPSHHSPVGWLKLCATRPPTTGGSAFAHRATRQPTIWAGPEIRGKFCRSAKVVASYVALGKSFARTPHKFPFIISLKPPTNFSKVSAKLCCVTAFNHRIEVRNFAKDRQLQCQRTTSHTYMCSIVPTRNHAHRESVQDHMPRATTSSH
jgi:hypothetical protein